MPIFKFIKYITFLTSLLIVSCAATPKNELNQAGFAKWQQQFKSYALKQNIAKNTIEDAFAEISFQDKYITSDRRQFTNKETLAEYSQKHINNTIVAKAKKIKETNSKLLKDISEDFQINTNYIISLWAIETKFGTYTGNDYVIEALANLAYEGRRREFFENELINALKMLENKEVSKKNFQGSWAGATGQVQFMPSTYYKYAIDYNQDGRTDIWQSKEDILASAANYLSSLDWDKDLPWGYEVTIKDSKKIKPSNRKKSLKKLHEKGLMRIDSEEFTTKELEEKVRVISYDERYFISFKNYDILKDWNNSDYFVITVGLFAETL